MGFLISDNQIASNVYSPDPVDSAEVSLEPKHSRFSIGLGSAAQRISLDLQGDEARFQVNNLWIPTVQAWGALDILAHDKLPTLKQSQAMPLAKPSSALKPLFQIGGFYQFSNLARGGSVCIGHDTIEEPFSKAYPLIGSEYALDVNWRMGGAFVRFGLEAQRITPSRAVSVSAFAYVGVSGGKASMAANNNLIYDFKQHVQGSDTYTVLGSEEQGAIDTVVDEATKDLINGSESIVASVDMGPGILIEGRGGRGLEASLLVTEFPVEGVTGMRAQASFYQRF
jgi:hypothetical protein